ncbi:hypothetical protein MUG87_09060 [Ectobacillus sp. JY-23]|uniref:hypothetical protein n=1 Tax=Ectobacillus sp. JY-23 TaxID=2933872 RepID=UPI001FF211C2|nr:hypothetical protein [Ectobacillus sp. JY-23]UOY94220.1 hypothetical protein MUG87_09060 [Ectobacillus sp. JY-23]
MFHRIKSILFFVLLSGALTFSAVYWGEVLLGESTVESVTAKPSEQLEQDMHFFLESKLVKKETVKGYVIETYQEYEVYKDALGNVVKSIPTSNYQYLRYKN